VTTRTRYSDVRHALHRGTIRKAFSSLLVVLAFCALGFAGYQVKTGQWHATPVLSGSMRPGMQPGDVVVTQRVPVSDLHVRDVVVFYPPNETERQTVHRIVKLTVKGGTTSITTWGDANLIADPAVSSLKGATAYRMVRVVPLLGYPAVWLQNGSRGILVIGLGAILLIAAVVTLLRPDKPSKPPGSPGSPNTDGEPAEDPAPDNAHPADSSGDPLETAAR
jgi:signal peptidase